MSTLRSLAITVGIVAIIGPFMMAGSVSTHTFKAFPGIICGGLVLIVAGMVLPSRKK